jgi:aquaporin NIP
MFHIDRRRLMAEAIGTFMLVFIGPGTAAVSAWAGREPSVAVALAFGFVILAGVYTLGHISGAHFNPAVSVGFWLGKRFPAKELLPYVGSQVFGAIAAALLLRVLLGDAANAAATTLAVRPVAGLIVEMILTFFLMLVVMAVATDARVAGPVAGIAVGLSVAFDALMGGPLTGASMNPARSLGPALATAIWSHHWVYWVGPLSGAFLAVRAYDYLRSGSSHDYRAAI